MKIPTKQICSVLSASMRSGSMRSDSVRAASVPSNRLTNRFRHRIRSAAPTFSTALTTVFFTAGLAIALTACSSNPPAQQSSAQTNAQSSAQTNTQSSSNANTEAVQTPADSTSATSALFVQDGVAIAGADPVAYFTEKAYVPGSADYTYDWQGATWQFSSAENRDLFAKNPEQYTPEYGGFCAWAVAAKNSLVPVDPNAWSVVDGKLYLNANQKVQENWLEDVPGFITKANENWPGLSRS